MAPSSTLYAASRRSFLGARDARQAVLDRHLGAGRTLVAISLAVPGEHKTPPGAGALFAWAVAELTSAFEDAWALHSGMDALGPFAVLATRAPAGRAKARCVAIETAWPAARLLDLDVYTPDGASLDRAVVRLAPRLCLCCDRPALECIVARRHDPGLLARTARALVVGGATDRLSAALVAGLRRELQLTPKPGLVDLDDCGSHPDLSLELMERSIGLVGAHFDALGASLARGKALAEQIAMTQRAETAMLTRLGSNTHKGALFLGGVLLVALDRAASDEEGAVRAAVSSVAREVAAAAPPRGTNGEAARRRFGVGGILREVEAGLPAIFDGAVPAFRDAVARGEDVGTASFRMLATLMQTVEDTTALHRCGAEGLVQLRTDGARLDRLIGTGGHVPFLRERNALYRRMNLTMGGVADLLGAALGWLAYTGELRSDPLRRS